MIRALFLALCLAAPASAATDAAGAAQAAAEALGQSAQALAAAKGSRDRVAALSRVVRGYEAGLAAMREGMRQAALRERAIRTDLEHEEGRLSALLGALQSMQTAPETLALLHPSGPLANARAAMILADVVPALDARAAELRARLAELRDLRAVQAGAGATLQQGLDGAEDARTALSRAISERAPPPDASATDLATMQALVNGADTLQGFAATLATLGGAAGDAGFAAQKGTLALPVEGAVLWRFDEPDAAGVRRPGLTMATEPLALVSAPIAATVRYAGPLLDHGTVVILEPEAGWLLVLSGLGESFARQGEVLDPGAPVGTMGGTVPGARDILIETGDGGSGQSLSETLYIELRQGETPVDPAPWFDAPTR